MLRGFKFVTPIFLDKFVKFAEISSRTYLLWSPQTHFARILLKLIFGEFCEITIVKPLKILKLKLDVVPK